MTERLRAHINCPCRIRARHGALDVLRGGLIDRVAACTGVIAHTVQWQDAGPSGRTVRRAGAAAGQPPAA